MYEFLRLSITYGLNIILEHNSLRKTMGYTVTEKGTVTIPAEVRRKLGLAKGSQVEFLETDQGVLVVLVVPLKKLMGIDRGRKKLVYEMIREIQEERVREAVEE